MAGLLPHTSVVLQNNGDDNLTVTANGTIAFHSSLASNARYAVTVVTQPSGQTCSVQAGTGSVATSNVNVAVSCSPNTYSLGGSVSGLVAGVSVVLKDSVSGGTVTVSRNGSFAFTGSIASGSQYSVSVVTQSTAENCALMGNAGTVAGQNITGISVACSVLSYAVAVNVAGLLPGSSLVLQEGSGELLTASGSGKFQFASPLLSGSPYAVTVQSQPAGQSCSIPDGSGTVGSATVDVTVICPWHVLYAASQIAGVTAVTAFIIDSTTGSLTAVPGLAYKAGQNVDRVVAAPGEKYLFVSVYTDGTQTESVYSAAVDPASAALTDVASISGAYDGQLLLNSAGTLLYPITNAGSIISFDPATGGTCQSL